MLIYSSYSEVFEENFLSVTLGSHHTLVRNNFLTLVVQLTISFAHSLLRKLLQRGLALILTLHNTTQLYFALSLIERCCAPAYKGGTKGDTIRLSNFFYRHHSISISESR